MATSLALLFSVLPVFNILTNACTPSNYIVLMTKARITWLIVVSLCTIAVLGQNLCGCLNNATCSLENHCLCPIGFIGQKCQLKAYPLKEQPISASLTSNLTYFYFQPTQINYYKLTFKICMLQNPSLLPSLFYIETEKSDGSLRQIQSLFETAKIILGEKRCTSFSTHYISIKRRQDQSYRKIVVGMRVLDKDDASHYLNVYGGEQQPSAKVQQTQQSNKDTPLPSQLREQIVTVEMKYERYMQTSSYADFIILSTACLLLTIFVAFINYLRRKYRFQLQERINQFQEFNVESYHYRTRLNPQLQRREERERRRKKNQLQCIEVFMPTTKYGEKSCFYVNESFSTCTQKFQAEGDTDSCSICLNNFQKEDQVRTTPCKHQYHRQCIDNWYSSNSSCPICRHSLDFNREIRKIYFHFLRGKQNR